ncbi:MAG: hypothetical protein SEPTF4163_002405 [Sporothrix epigloea]
MSTHGVPLLKGPENYHQWWKATKNVIGQTSSVAFLNIDDPRYADWDTARARRSFCGEPPPVEFPYPRPDEPGERSASRYNTRSASGQAEEIEIVPQEHEQFERAIKVWEEKKEKWQVARDRYQKNNRLFESDLTAIEKVIDGTVPENYKSSFKDGFGAEQKIKAVLQRARPEKEDMAEVLESQYIGTMNAFPRFKADSNSALDEWLQRWEVMIGDQSDHGGEKVSGTKWMRQFAGKFMTVWPTLAAQIVEYSERLDGARQDQVEVAYKLLQMVRKKRRFEKETEEDDAPQKKRTRGQAFASFEAADSDDEEEAAQSAPPAKEKGDYRPQVAQKKARYSGRANMRGASSNDDKVCEACQRTGHSLEACWCLFPEQRPARFIVDKDLEMKTWRRVAINQDLAGRVKNASSSKAAGH